MQPNFKQHDKNINFNATAYVNLMDENVNTEKPRTNYDNGL